MIDQLSQLEESNNKNWRELHSITREKSEEENKP